MPHAVGLGLLAFAPLAGDYSLAALALWSAALPGLLLTLVAPRAGVVYAPTTVVALLFAAVLATAHGAAPSLGLTARQVLAVSGATVALAFVFQWLLGVLRLASVARFLPISVTHGFAAGVGLSMVLGQVHNGFGAGAAALWDTRTGWHALAAFAVVGLAWWLRRLWPRMPGLMSAVVLVGLRLWPHAPLEQAVTADAQLASEDLKKLAARAKSLRELLQGLPRQGSSSAKAEPQGQIAGPGIRNTSFINPSAGTLIRRFGQTAPRTGAAGGGRSEGWTWRTDKGASVRAPTQGTVEYAGPLKGWGMVLILRLGGGYHLVLAGMDQTTAEAGRTLSAGEPVGRMGDQDRPTPELYMEIRRDGSPVDPARWMASLRATGAG